MSCITKWFFKKSMYKGISISIFTHKLQNVTRPNLVPAGKAQSSSLEFQLAGLLHYLFPAVTMAEQLTFPEVRIFTKLKSVPVSTVLHYQLARCLQLRYWTVYPHWTRVWTTHLPQLVWSRLVATSAGILWIGGWDWIVSERKCQHHGEWKRKSNIEWWQTSHSTTNHVSTHWVIYKIFQFKLL